MNETRPFSQEPGLPRLLYGTKRMAEFMYANLEAMRHLAVFWRQESGEGKRNNLVQSFWRQECVCVIYCLNVYQLLPSSHCLLLTYGQFTLPLELFSRSEFRYVRAYCIVLQFWFNNTYFLPQEYMKHKLVNIRIICAGLHKSWTVVLILFPYTKPLKLSLSLQVTAWRNSLSSEAGEGCPQALSVLHHRPLPIESYCIFK